MAQNYNKVLTIRKDLYDAISRSEFRLVYIGTTIDESIKYRFDLSSDGTYSVHDIYGGKMEFIEEGYCNVDKVTDYFSHVVDNELYLMPTYFDAEGVYDGGSDSIIFVFDNVTYEIGGYARDHVDFKYKDFKVKLSELVNIDLYW